MLNNVVLVGGLAASHEVDVRVVSHDNAVAVGDDLLSGHLTQLLDAVGGQLIRVFLNVVLERAALSGENAPQRAGDLVREIYDCALRVNEEKLGHGL